jgi:CubicO group peptidase (beta-lactamase class C family)
VQSLTLLTCGLVVAAVTALGQPKPYFPPPDAKGGWRTLTEPARIREVTSIDTAKLDLAFDYVQNTTQHGGLLVVRHGYLVYERYFGRGHREALPELASCGKAFTTVATGILMKQQPARFPNGLDQKIFTPPYLPAEAFPLNDPRKADITLGQVLAMSAGIRGTNPVYVNGKRQQWENPTEDNGPYSTTDGFACAKRSGARPAIATPMPPPPATSRP